MRIAMTFTIQPVGNRFVAVPVGEASKKFRGMIQLNETGAFLWKQLLEKDMTEEELTDALMAEYAVDRETAAGSVHRMAEELSENGFLA